MVKNILNWDRFKTVMNSLTAASIECVKLEMDDTGDFYSLMLASQAGVSFTYELPKTAGTATNDYLNNHRTNFVRVCSSDEYVARAEVLNEK
jgi:hypothetical protein